MRAVQLKLFRVSTVLNMSTVVAIYITCLQSCWYGSEVLSLKPRSLQKSTYHSSHRNLQKSTYHSSHGNLQKSTYHSSHGNLQKSTHHSSHGNLQKSTYHSSQKSTYHSSHGNLQKSTCTLQVTASYRSCCLCLLAVRFKPPALLTQSCMQQRNTPPI